MKYDLLDYDISRYEDIIAILEDRIEQAVEHGSPHVKWEDSLVDNERILEYLKTLKDLVY